MNYTKAFERYWKNARIGVSLITAWQREALKRTAFRSWQAGRRYQDKSYGRQSISGRKLRITV